jgi:NADPH:quinone reductase-like Zn-dependent oxidoreductase
MKAVRIHAYGDNSVLQFEDAPKSEVKADEALVRVVAAAVNPIDWKIRQGHLKAIVPYAFPLTLGWDFSGVIEALGSEVSSFAVGDAVFSRPDIRRDGSYAEYIAVHRISRCAFVRSRKWSSLRAWDMKIANSRGMARARVAVARKLAVVLHRV